MTKKCEAHVQDETLLREKLEAVTGDDADNVGGNAGNDHEDLDSMILGDDDDEEEDEDDEEDDDRHKGSDADDDGKGSDTSDSDKTGSVWCLILC